MSTRIVVCFIKILATWLKKKGDLQAFGYEAST